MDKILGVMLGLVLVVAAVGCMTPTLAYACPICGAPFATYDELYQHFITEHPAEDITIIWE